MTAHFQRNDQATTGSYQRMSTRLMGCFASECTVPTSNALPARESQGQRKLKLLTWVMTTRSAGSSVIASTAATIMAKVLV